MVIFFINWSNIQQPNYNIKLLHKGKFAIQYSIGAKPIKIKMELEKIFDTSNLFTRFYFLNKTYNRQFKL